MLKKNRTWTSSLWKASNSVFRTPCVFLAGLHRFKAATGIPVYKWDVSSYESCSTGIKQVEADLGPIEVLVNNAGITRDAMFHRMTPDQWNAVINTNLNSLFNMCRPVIEGMRSRKFGRIRPGDPPAATDNATDRSRRRRFRRHTERAR